VAVQAQKMGPGVFTIGEVGTPLDLTAQVISAKVTPSVNTEDATMTLSGETLAGDRSTTWKLAATLIQDLTEDGMFDYTWANDGDEVPFTFTPSTAAGRTITGTVVVAPLELGGDVGVKKSTTDLEWDIVGTPTLGEDL
jgi:hypothetical protein